MPAIITVLRGTLMFDGHLDSLIDSCCMALEQYYTVKQIAAALQLAPCTVRMYLARYRIRVLRIGVEIRVSERSVARLVRRWQSVTPEAPSQTLAARAAHAKRYQASQRIDTWLQQQQRQAA